MAQDLGTTSVSSSRELAGGPPVLRRIADWLPDPHCGFRQEIMTPLDARVSPYKE